MRTTTITLVALIASIATETNAKSSRAISCVSSGSWACGPEDKDGRSICIDSGVHGGFKYRIDFLRMTLRGPDGKAKLVALPDGRFGKTWSVGKTGTLHYGRRAVLGTDPRERDLFFLIPAPGLRTIELVCDPLP